MIIIYELARRRRAIVTLLALIVTAIGFAVAAPHAGADTVAQYHVTEDVSGRQSPVAAASPDYGVPAGALVDVQCQVVGEPVGPLGNDLYFSVVYDGRSLYVPDTWTDSPHHAGQPPIDGIPMCDDASSGASSDASSGSVPTWQPNCTGNAYVAGVQVQDFTDGQFEIKATPTSNTRYSTLSGTYMLEAMNQIWSAVQACVSGLYGNLADSIYQQIECHVLGTVSGPFHAGGPTFDFESWRGTTDPSDYIPSRCNWGGWPYEQVGLPYTPNGLSNHPTF